MKIRQNIMLIGLIAILISCDSKSQNQKPNISASVETEKPNSKDLQPAFAGQTRITAVKTNTAYKVEIINQNLGKAWGIAQLPDGRFLITEKTGFKNFLIL